MELKSYFTDFLAEIRPTDNDVEDYITGHSTLTKRLKADDTLGKIIISTFLQGSYRRATAVRTVNGLRADVDVVVVTKLSEEEYSPQEAMDLFVPFLDNWYAGKYKFNTRSIKIELTYVEMDLVITSAPSESQIGILESDSVTSDYSLEDARDWVLTKSWVSPDKRQLNRQYFFGETLKNASGWQTEPLHIPDRELKKWEPTHPLAQIEWTWNKNKATNQNYVNVVKALKWWRRVNFSHVKYPKGYPLEHMIGDNCPDGIESVAVGITRTLENIVNAYKLYSELGIVPFLKDRGVPEHNVLARLSFDDFKAFYQSVCDAAIIARSALDENDDLAASVEGWKQLFGAKFPEPPTNSNNAKGGYTPRNDVSVVSGGRFA